MEKEPTMDINVGDIKTEEGKPIKILDIVKPKSLYGVEYVKLVDVYKALGLDNIVGYGMDVRSAYSGWVKDDEGNWHFGFLIMRKFDNKFVVFLDNEIIKCIELDKEL